MVMESASLPYPHFGAARKMKNTYSTSYIFFVRVRVETSGNMVLYYIRKVSPDLFLVKRIKIRREDEDKVS